MLDNLIRVWTADADILAALPALQAYVAPRCRGELDPDEVDLTYAPKSAGAPEMSILHCYSANEHADLWHPAWTAILVVQSAGHRVGLVDYRPNKGSEACDYAVDAPRREIPLVPGQIVWLNDHHTHWLSPAPDESRFIGITLDFENTEEPEAITMRFRALLAAHDLLTAPETAMSSRICRTIGWGMPWSDFLARVRIDAAATDMTDALTDHFDAADDSRLTVPKDYATEHLRSLPVRGTIIAERRLLATEFTQFGRIASPIGPASDLYTLVWNGDTITTIVFFPNLYYRAKWFRRDDDIDYAFERYRGDGDGSGAASEPRNSETWTALGHYPWNNDRMDADGTPLTWDPVDDLCATPGRHPAVPSEIRWYLGALGILDEAGINALRPVIAQWWT